MGALGDTFLLDDSSHPNHSAISPWLRFLLSVVSCTWVPVSLLELLDEMWVLLRCCLRLCCLPPDVDVLSVACSASCFWFPAIVAAALVIVSPSHPHWSVDCCYPFAFVSAVDVVAVFPTCLC